MPQKTRRRPIILGIVGDSATGKTTLSSGIARILGVENVSVICTDDYHRYNRQQRRDLGITPLHPECNYLDIMAQHLRLLRAGEPILMPYYNHTLGDFGPSQYVAPHPFLIVEGLLGMYWRQMRDTYSVRVYLDPPERLRYQWKVRRDTTLRGYTEDEVLHELSLRERDSQLYIWPQRNNADVIVSFFRTRTSGDQIDEAALAEEKEDDTHLNVRLTLHGTLHHPDFSEVIAEDTSGCVRSRLGREGGRAVEYLEIDGSIPDEPARALERCILDHLDAFCGGTSIADLGLYYDSETRHSHPLALTQLFIVYHLLSAQHSDDNLT